MARYRMIKPQFWGNEQLAECSFGARLFFIGLMNFSDDNGIQENRPKKLKMSIFPADNTDVIKFIKELQENKLIEIYESNGQEYIWIINFVKHQRVDKASYDFPLPDIETLKKYGFEIDSENGLRIVVEFSTSKVKKRKEKLSKEKIKEIAGEIFLKDLNNFLPVLSEWLSYKEERNEEYTERGFKAFCNSLQELSGNSVETATKITSQSYERNWQGIFELTGKNHSNPIKKDISKLNFD